MRSHRSLVWVSLSGLVAGFALTACDPLFTHDYIVSFEDGKPYKTLRRHLTLRGLSPEAYREKWGLPRDYPMTAASYSAQRSELARALGLGQQRRKSRGAAAAPAPDEPAPAAPKTRGRKKVPAE